MNTELILSHEDRYGKVYHMITMTPIIMTEASVYEKENKWEKIK